MILNFKDDIYGDSSINFPSKLDVLQLNARHDRTDKDDMVNLFDWDGGCWQTLFEGVVKEKADEYGMKQWDVFAALIHNFIYL